jgi:hypothetical protein
MGEELLLALDPSFSFIPLQREAVYSVSGVISEEEPTMRAGIGLDVEGTVFPRFDRLLNRILAVRAHSHVHQRVN